MRKLVEDVWEKYNHKGLYSFKKFALFPTKVYCYRTKQYYKIWLESYYQTLVARHGSVEGQHYVYFDTSIYHDIKRFSLYPFPFQGITESDAYDKLQVVPTEHELVAKELAEVIEGK